MKKIAIFASGNGSNAENIYKFFANGSRISVPLIIYDRPDAGIAERMKNYPDVQTLYVPAEVWKENPAAILDILGKEDIDLVALAGFLRFIPREITEAYAGRMLNIHPSLLPAYGGPGMYGHKVHKAVIAAGETKSGVTVHYVSEVIDGGDILMSREVEIEPGETPESLEEKIHAVEYDLYPRAIVAALQKLDSEKAGTANASQITDDSEPAAIAEEAVVITEDVPQNPPSIPGVTPPPSPAEEWAETLGINYDEEKFRSAAGSHSMQPEDAVNPQSNPASQWQGVPQQPRQAPGAPEQPGQPTDKMPPTYLVWAVVMTVLCCLPAGIVAIIFSCQVSSKFYAGDLAGAIHASERAQIWIIVSFVLGIMTNTLYLPLMLLF